VARAADSSSWVGTASLSTTWSSGFCGGGFPAVESLNFGIWPCISPPSTLFLFNCSELLSSLSRVVDVLRGFAAWSALLFLLPEAMISTNRCDWT
jgi:hypothetical protein